MFSGRVIILACTLVVFAVVVQAQTRNSASISVFEEPDYGGESFLIPIRRCVNLNRFANRVSSVNTHEGCVTLYSERACRGRSIDLVPGLRGQDDLLALDFDETAQSVGVCQ